MSNFFIEKETYDPVSVDLSISRFETQLDDEIMLNKTLNDNNVDDKIIDATRFLNEYGDKINDQYTKLTQLDNDIREIIFANKEMQTQDAEFDALINSETYTDLASKMASIKQIIASLDSFLVEQGAKESPEESIVSSDSQNLEDPEDF